MLRRTTLLLLAAAAAVLAAVGVSSATGRDDDRPARADRPERTERVALRGDRGARADHRALVREARRAVLAGAPATAAPVIDAAVAAGRLDAARATQLREAIAALRDGRRPQPARLRALLLDDASRSVVLEVARALAERAPALADPVLDRAVADGTLTERRAERLRAKAGRVATRLAEPATGVWLEAAAAVVRAAPGVAAPVLDRAVADDRLTREQADAVLAAVRTLDPRRAMGAVALDPDARGVARELARALAERVPALIDPVLDAAVADGRLTEQRADRLRERVARRLTRLP